MKIGYFADGPWSHATLQRLSDDARFRIVFIVPRYDTRDPVLAEHARRLGVDFLLLDDVNSGSSLESLRAYGADLFVSMSYNQIFRRRCIELAPLGVVNCHAGALPYYRGRNILNWALINDASSFGVTAHYVNEGIDTGDIIIQRHLPISDQDDYGSLLARAIEACADVLVDALDRIARGDAQPVKQSSIHPVGTYFGRRLPGDEWIDWTWPSRRIFNFVRAIAPPGPAARTLHDGRLVEVFAARPIQNAIDYIATPGEVVGRNADGVVVKTGDSTLLLTSTRVHGGGTLRIGARLGFDVTSELMRLRDRIEELERRLASPREVGE